MKSSCPTNSQARENTCSSSRWKISWLTKTSRLTSPSSGLTRSRIDGFSMDDTLIVRAPLRSSRYSSLGRLDACPIDDLFPARTLVHEEGGELAMPEPERREPDFFQFFLHTEFSRGGHDQITDLVGQVSRHPRRSE